MASSSLLEAPSGPRIAADECADCHKTGVPLHANDDPSAASGSSSSAGTKQRFCAQCMIGKKVRVFWPVDKSWYTGTVEQYDPASGEHLLRYDDNDVEWVKIGDLSGAGGGNNRSASPPPTVADLPPTHSPIQHQPDGIKSETSPVPHHHPPPPPHHSVPYDGTPDRYSRGPPPYPPYGGPGPQPHHHPYPPPQTHPGYGMPYPPSSYGGPPPPPYGGPPPPYSYPPMMSLGPAPPDRRGPDSVSSTPNTNGEKGSGKKKAGPKVWTKEEDQMLLNMVQNMRMPMKWSVVAQQMPDRTGKQCRERYVNHLNPRLKATDWSPVEDSTIFHLYNTTGSHWAKMSKMIPGRTDNGIKNRFHNLRRQLEREDEHRLRLSKTEDFSEEIRLDRLRDFPQHMKGKNNDLWDITRGVAVLATQSVLGGGIARNAGRFGPFRTPENADLCVRCGFLVPSVHTGNELCTKTGWCISCTRIPPHMSGALLRECLNLRRCEDKSMRKIVESWEELFATKETSGSSKEALTEEDRLKEDDEEAEKSGNPQVVQ